MWIIFDPMYFVFLAPALILMAIAQFWIRSAFAKYSQVTTSSQMTGAEVARAILEANGIYDVRVEISEGFLSDHYDPMEKVLRLSPEVYHSPSAAAVGVAAHEVGHAIQHAKGYVPLYVRSALVPLVQLGSTLYLPLLLLGMFLASFQLFMAGIICFGAIAVFQIVTLPVEFDASARAIRQIQELGIVRGEEVVGAKRILTAAALTYVAAAIQSVLTILYYLWRAGLLGGGDD
ncbi:MAG: zinc metallopeptidase [Planctomycetota bacterium]|nr:MAG: zinc metallopeptidase [Planctomycetota bacterium]